MNGEERLTSRFSATVAIFLVRSYSPVISRVSGDLVSPWHETGGARALMIKAMSSF